MSTPLTDSINALTAYANEVTGASDTTLSDAVETLIAGYSGLKIANGTFTADGTTPTAYLNTGFEPDIVFVDSDLDYESAGWIGIGRVIIVKNAMAAHLRHNNATITNAQITATYKIGGDYPPYGAVINDYTSYGEYSNGVFKVSNGTNNAITRFVGDVIYKWVALKYTQ